MKISSFNLLCVVFTTSLTLIPRMAVATTALDYSTEDDAGGTNNGRPSQNLRRSDANQKKKREQRSRRAFVNPSNRFIIQYEHNSKETFMQSIQTAIQTSIEKQAQSSDFDGDDPGPGPIQLHYVFDQIDCVVMTVSPEELEELEDSPNVTQIVPDVPRYPQYIRAETQEKKQKYPTNAPSSESKGKIVTYSMTHHKFQSDPFTKDDPTVNHDPDRDDPADAAGNRDDPADDADDGSPRRPPKGKISTYSMTHHHFQSDPFAESVTNDENKNDKKNTTTNTNNTGSGDPFRSLYVNLEEENGSETDGEEGGANDHDLSLLADDSVPYGIPMVQAPDVWEQFQVRGEGIRVCVIDTGFDATHEDFVPNNVDGFDNDLNWYQDYVGHGTHCSGTIAAAENDLGVIGVAPNAEIYTVKVFDNNGRFAYSSSLIAAAERCAEAGAQILSMSLGGPQSNSFEERAFARLISEKNILPIAAAGNSGNTDKSYPASYEGVVSVAAVDSNKLRARFSQRNNAVDIAAPGVDVLSTLPSSGPCEICSSVGSFKYGAISGTSMAAPHVAGVAALLMSYQPSPSASEVAQALISTAEDLGSTGRDNSYGHGLVQALAAIESLNGGGGGSGGDGGDDESGSDPGDDPVDDGNGDNGGTIGDDVTGCPLGSKPFQLRLKTDRYGSETSWELLRLSDGASISDSNLDGYRNYVVDRCLSNENCYQFTIRDSFGDGLCCSHGEGEYSVSYDGEVIKSGASFGSEDGITFGFSDDCSNESDGAPPIATPTLTPTSSPTSTPTSAPQGDDTGGDSGPRCDAQQLSFDIFIRTDGYAVENSFQLTDSSGNVVWETSNLSNLIDYNFKECVDANGCYTFSAFDSVGDGMCCRYGLGGFIVSVDGVEKGRGTAFGSQEEISKLGNCS